METCMVFSIDYLKSIDSFHIMSQPLCYLVADVPKESFLMTKVEMEIGNKNGLALRTRKDTYIILQIYLIGVKREKNAAKRLSIKLNDGNIGDEDFEHEQKVRTLNTHGDDLLPQKYRISDPHRVKHPLILYSNLVKGDSVQLKYGSLLGQTLLLT